jgi:hypothetical protein
VEAKNVWHNRYLGLLRISQNSGRFFECFAAHLLFRLQTNQLWKVSPNDIGQYKRTKKSKIQIDANNYNQWGLLEGKVRYRPQYYCAREQVF